MSDFPEQPFLRRSCSGDWQAVQQLLLDAGLPVEDLAPTMLTDFLIAEKSGSIVGAVGLQKFEETGLLRSLVVAKSARGSGLGSQLLGGLEAAARGSGVADLWLLTIDAEAFFSQHGFETMPREQAPASIRQTDEFRDLCPGDAYLMCKSID